MLRIVRTTREEQAALRERLAEERRQHAEFSERVKHAEFLTTHGLLAEMGNGVECDWDPS